MYRICTNEVINHEHFKYSSFILLKYYFSSQSASTLTHFFRPGTYLKNSVVVG